jgi:hypothetical protein
MNSTRPHNPLEPIAAAVKRPVQVAAKTVHIHSLSIERPKVVAYLETIPPDKQELALMHALDVGVTEVLARRGRFGKTPA